MVLPDFNVCGLGISTFYKKPKNLTAEEIEQDLATLGGPRPQESITFVTLLFGIEREAGELGVTEKVRQHLIGGENMDLTIFTCGVIGMALGGPVTGGMLGVAAGTMLHKAIGITPEGTGYCIKEFAKRELLGVGKLTCTRCNQRPGKTEKDEDVYCDECWGEVGGEEEDPDAFVVL
jgi:hypothetical protein